MKKLLSLLVAGTVFLSGCSLPGFDSDASTSAPVAVVENTVPENPKELFYSLSSSHAKAWNEKIAEYIPSKEVLLKNKTTFSLAGNGDLSSVMGAGKVDFSIQASGEKDVRDEKNPLGSANISIDAKTQGTPFDFSVNAQAGFKVINNSAFASLESFKSNISLAPQVQEMADEFVGKWFGNSFAELSELSGNPDFDIQKLVASKGIMIIALETMEMAEKNPEKFMTFVKGLPSKNGMHFFEATVNAEGVREMMLKIFSSFGIPQAQLDTIIADFDKAMEAQKGQNIVIGYSPSDALAFSSTGAAIDLETAEVIPGKENTVSASKDGFEAKFFVSQDVSVAMSTMGGKISLSITDKQKTATPLTGTYSDTSLVFMISDPDKAGEKIGEGSFTKSGDTWAGEITSPQAPGKLKISNFKISKGNFSLSLEALMGAGDQMQSLGKIDLTSTIEGVDSVSVEAPSEFQPFENIEKIISAFEAKNRAIPVETQDSTKITGEVINLDDVPE